MNFECWLMEKKEGFVQFSKRWLLALACGSEIRIINPVLIIPNADEYRL
jgi:hypothetical protein